MLCCPAGASARRAYIPCCSHWRRSFRLWTPAVLLGGCGAAPNPCCAPLPHIPAPWQGLGRCWALAVQGSVTVGNTTMLLCLLPSKRQRCDSARSTMRGGSLYAAAGRPCAREVSRVRGACMGAGGQARVSGVARVWGGGRGTQAAARVAMFAAVPWWVRAVYTHSQVAPEKKVTPKVRLEDMARGDAMSPAVRPAGPGARS